MRHIPECLKNVYWGAMVDVSTAQCWVQHRGEDVEGKSLTAYGECTDCPPNAKTT